MVLLSPFDYLLMSSVAKWSVSRHFAVAKLVITWLVYIKTNWSAASQNPFALTIAEGVDLGMAAWTPVVRFAPVKENMSWEDTSIWGHAGWTISTLFVRTWLLQVNDFLFGEVRHVFHRFSRTLEFSWFENNRGGLHYITLVGLHLTADGAIRIRNRIALTWHSRSALLSRGQLF